MPARPPYLLLRRRLQALQVLLERLVLAFQLRQARLPRLSRHRRLWVVLEMQHPSGGGVELSPAHTLLQRKRRQQRGPGVGWIS